MEIGESFSSEHEFKSIITWDKLYEAGNLYKETESAIDVHIFHNFRKIILIICIYLQLSVSGCDEF